MTSGASKYLTNLPSRGLFTGSTNLSSTQGMRVYICDRDTSPPEDQMIKTNPTNILIRSLQLNKQKSDGTPKGAKGKAAPDRAKGKRASERAADGKVPAKRANIAPNSRSSRQEGSSSRTPEKDLQGLTVEKLRAILKERGLPTKGKKDELISRLKGGKADTEDRSNGNK